MAQEVALFSHYLKVAGRADLVAYYDGVLSIIDFKTSKTVKTEKDIEDYFIQVSGYAAMFYERTGIAIKQGVVIMVVDYSSKPLIFKVGTYEWLPEVINTLKMYYMKNAE
jgi:genome maintenance exonuclease 1